MTARPILTAVALLALSANPGRAAVKIADGWVRAPPRGAPTAAAYLTLTNPGRAPDRLLGATTPAAENAGVHSMSMVGGVMRMRALDAGLPLPGGASVRLQPGGDHLMLTGLKQPLTVGSRVALTLRFQRAGEVRVSLPVRAAPPA